jgi:hypothetical protein
VRQLTLPLALATALLAGSCADGDRRDLDQPYRADTVRPLPPRGPAASDPAMSPGASDSVTSGSTSNAASGSSATRQSAPMR